MKIPVSEYQRRGIVPLTGLVLAVYYLFVMVPLARKSQSLDEPLQQAWQKLSASLDQTNTAAIDFQHITNQLSETRQALLILENARQQAAARLKLGAAVRARMHAAFALVVTARAVDPGRPSPGRGLPSPRHRPPQQPLGASWGRPRYSGREGRRFA